MSEYRKQAAFLKAMMTFEEGADDCELRERLSHAERNERCLLCSCRLVALIALLGFAGLGYSAVLLPEFFDQTTHAIIHICTALCLGSLFCLVVFLGLWFWYRSLVNRIHEDCRRLVITTFEVRLKGNRTNLLREPVQEPGICIRISTSASAQGQPRTAGLLGLPKAS